jgi:hypothetical protein
MPQTPEVFQLILPAEAEQRSSEETSSSSSDDILVVLKMFIKSIYSWVIMKYFL